jgi:hypothetical protein
MSCFDPNYNPNPTRTWFRVDNQCQIPSTSDGRVYIQALKIYVPIEEVSYYIQLLRKGNILQYKNNSSNLTKNQKYSQIAKGKWNQRKTTYASQTDSYTNPNTTCMQRINYRNITTDGTETNDPITCPPSNPNGRGGQIIPFLIPTANTPTDAIIQPPKVIPDPIQIPPRIAPVTNDSVLPNILPILPIVPPAPIVIPSGGSLVCNTYEDICTGEVITKPRSDNCYLTSCSDVPGPLAYLCYDDSQPTYYPRERRTYTSIDTPITFPGSNVVEYDNLSDILVVARLINPFILLLKNRDFAQLVQNFTPEVNSNISDTITRLHDEYYNNSRIRYLLTFMSNVLSTINVTIETYDTTVSQSSTITSLQQQIRYYETILNDISLLREYLSRNNVEIIPTIDIDTQPVQLSDDILVWIQINGYPSPENIINFNQVDSISAVLLNGTPVETYRQYVIELLKFNIYDLFCYYVYYYDSTDDTLNTVSVPYHPSNANEIAIANTLVVQYIDGIRQGTINYRDQSVVDYLKYQVSLFNFLILSTTSPRFSLNQINNYMRTTSSDAINISFGQIYSDINAIFTNGYNSSTVYEYNPIGGNSQIYQNVYTLYVSIKTCYYANYYPNI